MEFSLERGHGRLRINVPGHKVLGVLKGRDIPALGLDRAGEIIARGVRDHAPADLRDRSAAVIIPDDTRLWARGDILVPAVIQGLTDAGAAPENIIVIIALGTHRPILESGFAALCGDGTPETVRVVNSAGLDPGRLVRIGTTPAGTPLTVTREAWEADHIVIFGGILHHMLAGFGGGRKYLLPGIAGDDAIQANHALAVDASGIPHPQVAQGVIQGNPVSQDMAAGAGIFLNGKTCTYAAVAANGQGEIFYAEAGGLNRVFERGCREVDRACRVDVDEPGDFVLFSAGGHRTDTQLYQATKALFNAVNLARENAVLLFVAGCAGGTGNPDFAEALVRYRDRPGDLGQKLVRDFNMPAYVALRVTDILRRHRVFLVSDLDEQTTRDLGFYFTPDPSRLAAELPGRGWVVPFAENILPRVVS